MSPPNSVDKLCTHVLWANQCFVTVTPIFSNDPRLKALPLLHRVECSATPQLNQTLCFSRIAVQCQWSTVIASVSGWVCHQLSQVEVEFPVEDVLEYGGKRAHSHPYSRNRQQRSAAQLYYSGVSISHRKYLVT